MNEFKFQWKFDQQNNKQIEEMNIRKIIGFGFIAALVGCQDQAATGQVTTGQPAKAACAFKREGSSAPKQNIYVNTVDKPQPKPLPKQPKSVKCGNKHTWKSQKGESHQTYQETDSQGIHHNIQKWKNDEGEEHQTDNFVDRDGTSNSHHNWIVKGETHKVVHKIAKDGTVKYFHDKKDRDGKVTRVDDDRKNRRRSLSKKSNGRSRSRSSNSSRDRSRSRGSQSRGKQCRGKQCRDQQRSKDNNGRDEQKSRKVQRTSQDKETVRQDRDRSNQGLKIGKHPHQCQGPNCPHQGCRGRQDSDSDSDSNEGHQHGPSRGPSVDHVPNHGPRRPTGIHVPNHGPRRPTGEHVLNPGPQGPSVGHAPIPQGPKVTILQPPNCSNLRAH